MREQEGVDCHTVSTRSVAFVYSIGDLAQLGGVTPRMLRHYHDLGVLMPAEVDRASGYRRCHEAQLADLLQMLRLHRVEQQIQRLENQMNNTANPTITISTKRLPAVHL